MGFVPSVAPTLWVTQRPMGTAEGCATGEASWKEAAARERVLQKGHLNTVSRRATPLACVVGAGWWWLGTAAPSPGSAAALTTAVRQMALQEEEVHRELLGTGRLHGCRGSNRGAGGLLPQRGGEGGRPECKAGGQGLQRVPEECRVPGRRGCLQACCYFGVVAHGVRKCGSLGLCKA